MFVTHYDAHTRIVAGSLVTNPRDRLPCGQRKPQTRLALQRRAVHTDKATPQASLSGTIPPNSAVVGYVTEVFFFFFFFFLVGPSPRICLPKSSLRVLRYQRPQYNW